MHPEKIEKIAKLAALCFGVAVAVSKILLSLGDQFATNHFAIFLLAQSWPELTCIAIAYGAFKVLRYIALGVYREAQSVGWQQLFAPGPLVPLLICSLLLIQILPPLVYLVRDRTIYWSQLTRKSYVETYKLRIDRLAAAGRVQDAYLLTKKVTQALGNTSEKYYLDVRLKRLETAVKLSERFSQRASQHWNPVTEREAFYRLVEAARINPQNYAATDSAKQMAKLTDTYLTRDSAAICSSGGDLHDFRGFALSLLEAKVLWAENDSKGHCEDSLQQLREAWGLDAVNCILELSDSTRGPFTTWDSSGKPFACTRSCSQYSVREGCNFLSAPKERTIQKKETQLSDNIRPQYPTLLDLLRAIARHSPPHVSLQD